MQRWHLTDAEWQQVRGVLTENQLPNSKSVGRPVKVNLKGIAEAALYHHFASLASKYKCFGWNELPSDPSGFCVSASSANRWYRRWLESGQWFRFWDLLVALRRGADGPRLCESPMGLLIKELERAYSFFNWHFMGNALPVRIIVSCGETDSCVAGWFNGRFDAKGKENSSIPHICISLHALTSTMEVCHTLLHEMAHLRNYVVGIKDCGRAQYHNRHFRDSALLFGVASARNSITGYASTHLDKRGEAAVFALDPDLSMIGLERLKRKE